MEKQALIKRGFKDTSFNCEGEIFTEHTLDIKDGKIEISGTDLVELVFTDHCCITVPNCKTIKDLDNLIKLFK